MKYTVITHFSMIPTTEVEARHGIPGCTYSIHRFVHPFPIYVIFLLHAILSIRDDFYDHSVLKIPPYSFDFIIISFHLRSSIDDLDAGKAAGPPIQFARVGDRVLHQWHCNDSMLLLLFYRLR